MTLKEYLSETYDILKERDPKTKWEGLKSFEWHTMFDRYNKKLAKVSDEEWKEAKKQLAHNLLNKQSEKVEKIYDKLLNEKESLLKELKPLNKHMENLQKYKNDPVIVDFLIPRIQQKISWINDKLDIIKKIEERRKFPKKRMSGVFKVDGPKKAIKLNTEAQKEINRIIKNAEEERREAKERFGEN